MQAPPSALALAQVCWVWAQMCCHSSYAQTLQRSMHRCPGAQEPQKPFVTCCPMCILQWAQQATLLQGLCPSLGLWACLQQQMVALRAKLHLAALNILKRFL